MDLFDQIHSKGNTVIMVTHEEDIAEYAHRIIRLRDGLMETDRANTNIRKANALMQAAKEQD
jgi:putative ABC transport system ATP-binding protein